MECYVCLEETCYSLSPCKCKNLYVHPHCFDKVVAHFTECGICKEPFYHPSIECKFEREEDPEDEEPKYPEFFKVIAKLLLSYVIMYIIISYLVYQEILFNGFIIFITTAVYLLCIIIFGNKI